MNEKKNTLQEIATTTTWTHLETNPNVNALLCVYVNKTNALNQWKCAECPFLLLFLWQSLLLFFSSFSLFVSAFHEYFIYYIETVLRVNELVYVLKRERKRDRACLCNTMSWNWFDCGFVQCSRIFFLSCCLVLSFDLGLMIVRPWMCCVFERIFHFFFLNIIAAVLFAAVAFFHSSVFFFAIQRNT